MELKERRLEVEMKPAERKLERSEDRRVHLRRRYFYGRRKGLKLDRHQAQRSDGYTGEVSHEQWLQIGGNREDHGLGHKEVITNTY